MKLLLRREQKSGFTGKVTFALAVRAELTEEEKSNIKKYKLAETMLYERDKMSDGGSGLLGLASRMAFKMVNISVSVKDLADGKTIEHFSRLLQTPRSAPATRYSTASEARCPATLPGSYV